jgi:PAS domain S-box-containing protein
MNELQKENLKLKKELLNLKKNQKITRAIDLQRLYGQLLIREDSEIHLLNNICKITVEEGKYKFAWIGFAMNDKTISAVSSAGFDNNYLNSIKISWGNDKYSKGPTGQAIKTGKYFVMQDIINNPKFQLWKSGAINNGFKSSIALPLIINKIVIGAINIYSDQENTFDEEEIKILMLAAQDLSLGISNIRQKKKIALQAIELTKSKEVISESEEKYRAIVENTSEWIWEMDETGAITYSNSVVEQILGHSSSELIGKNNIALINKLDRERIAKIFLKKVELKGGWKDLELRWNHKDGGYRYLESSAIPILNEKGILQGFRGVNRDITERKKTKQKIEESERNFRELFEKSGDAILIIENGIFIDCNQATIEMLKYKSKEVFLNSHPSKLSPKLQPDGLGSRIKAEEMMVLALNNGTHRFEWIHTKSDGELFPVEVLLTAISNESNKKVIHCVWRDIAERKKADEVLNESVELTKAITQSAPNAIITINLEGFILSWNKTAEKIFGSTSFEMINKSIQKIIPIQEISKHKKRLNILNNIRKEKLFGKPIQLQGLRKDGTKFPMELSLSSWNVGNKKCYTGIIRDVTEREQREAENKKLSTVVEQSANTVLITDINGKIEYINPRFTEVSGYTAKEIIGNYPRILKSGKHPKEYYTQLWKTINSGKIWKGEFQNKAKNGELFWEQVTISPIRNDEGEIINFLSIREDISIQKEAEKELNKALIKAKESDKLKSSFLASMSHEIRTPMNSIIGFSEFLLELNLPENKRKDYAEIIITNSKRLLTIVNDLLDISKIEAGVVQLNYQSVNINKMLNDLYIFYKPIAIKNNLELTCKLGLDNFKSVIDIDRTKLNQILTNLLSNAFKFTNEGEVEFGYKLIKNNLQFYVKDTGDGIDEKLKNKIFDRFFQGSLDLNKQYAGTGLGLAISKNFVELFNGEIWVTSSEKGTTVYFTIPYTKKKTPLMSTVFVNKKEQIKGGIEEKTKDITILVAEDEEYNIP